MNEHTFCRIMAKDGRREYRKHLREFGHNSVNTFKGVYKGMEMNGSFWCEVRFNDGFYWGDYACCAYEARAKTMDAHAVHLTGWALMPEGY